METSVAALRAPLPEKMVREVLPNGVAFTYRWFGLQYLFLAFFCVIWNSFLFSWYTAATSGVDWSKGLEALQADRLSMLLFPIGHLAVGIGLTYYTICGFVNRTRVAVASRVITISHGPLPWRGNRTVPGSDVQQLYREEVVSRTKNGTRTSYQLSAIRKDNSKVKLLAGLAGADLALFLEQEIEQALGIRDQPVSGEMRK
jgi:hypothetical protein